MYSSAWKSLLALVPYSDCNFDNNEDPSHSKIPPEGIGILPSIYSLVQACSQISQQCSAVVCYYLRTSSPQHFRWPRRDQAEGYTQDDDPPQYTLGSGALEKPISTRSQLECRIVKLWKKVWLGLYQIDDNEDRYHVERLEALSLGAGLTRTYRVGELQVLRRHFLRSETNNGIASLKLFQGLSLSSLLSVIHILEAYESEIDNLRLLYSILRSGQLALHETADLAKTAVVRTEYMAIAEPMEKRIRQYDIRMNVLNMDICDEALGFYERQKGEYVYHKAFPNAW